MNYIAIASIINGYHSSDSSGSPINCIWWVGVFISVPTSYIAWSRHLQKHCYTILITGKPILRLDVCSESEAIFTCVVMESILEWDIDFLTGSDIDGVLFPSPGELTPHRSSGVVYRFMVTSSSPFTSTMTTNTPADLSGARVSCFNSRQSSAEGTTLILPRKNTKL